MRLVAKNKIELESLIVSQKIALPIEQSFLWQDFDAAIPDRKPLGVFVVEDDKKIHAIIGMTLYNMQRYQWVWAKHGPYFVNKEPAESVIKEVLDAVVAYTKAQVPAAVFIRVTTPKVRFALKAPIHHTMYDRTIVIDINRSNDELLASMTRSGRYDVKKSLKSGIEFSEVPTEVAVKEFDQYYAILHETAKRDGFRPNEKFMYEAMLKALGANAHLFAAHYEGKPIAWALVTDYCSKGVYYYAASNDTARKLCAAYGLQYFAMQELRDKGCTEYDMMGIASESFPSLASVTGFKKKFSHEFVDIHKTFDIPLKPAKYATIKVAKKAKAAVKK